VNRPFFPLRNLVAVRLTPAAAALMLAGCASSADMLALREAPGFQAGYGDGCVTATEEDKSFSTKTTRDAYAFDNDEAYRAGWRQGYLECSNQTPEAKDGGRILGERNEY
jgi:hypothetical protein